MLSSDDPVRVFQQFATLDLLSGGRAEIMAGRGSFIESFPLFGYDLDDYDALFAEKLELLLKVRDNERVTWSGAHRAPLHDQGIYPRTRRDLPIWVAVGGNPPSAVRAGTLNLPMALAIIGGMPERFAPFVNLFRQAASQAGHDAERLPVGINTHGYVADTSQQAADEFFPSYAAQMTPDRSRARLAADHAGAVRRRADAARPLALGSPQEVIGENPLPAPGCWLTGVTKAARGGGRNRTETLGSKESPGVGKGVGGGEGGKNPREVAANGAEPVAVVDVLAELHDAVGRGPGGDIDPVERHRACSAARPCARRS